MNTAVGDNCYVGIDRQEHEVALLCVGSVFVLMASTYRENNDEAGGGGAAREKNAREIAGVVRPSA